MIVNHFAQLVRHFRNPFQAFLISVSINQVINLPNCGLGKVVGADLGR